MMTKDKLEQMYYLRREIMNDTEELVALKSRLRLGGAEDFWRDSDEKLILEEERRLNRKLERCRRLKAELDAFVTGLDDELERRIVRLRYEKGLSWGAVAYLTGGINSDDGVRKIAERCLERGRADKK